MILQILHPKTNLANLKTEVDKLDIDKLVPIPVDLSKLSDVVKNDVKKTVYNKLVAKFRKLNITLTRQSKKIKLLILVILLKKLIIILKLLN